MSNWEWVNDCEIDPLEDVLFEINGSEEPDMDLDDIIKMFLNKPI